MHDLAQRRTEAFEISTAEADEAIHYTSGGKKAAGVVGAAGAGAVAGLTCGPLAIVCSPLFGLTAAGGVGTSVLMDGFAASRTHALLDRLRADAQPAAFITGIAERVRQDVGTQARTTAGPRIQLVLTVSRVELAPEIPAHAHLLVWVEAQARLVDAAGAPRDARQRYVHVGESRDLDYLEQRPDALAREVALAREQLARKIARDLRL